MKVTRRQLRQIILQEVRIKPSVTNIPPQHLDKIHSLIEDGEFEQAQSFIDAFDGDPDYVDNYIAYGEVGDLEKMGNEVAAVFGDPLPFDPDGPMPARPLKPGFSYDDVYAKDEEAYALARKKRDDHRDSYPPGFDAQEAYYTHIDRYSINRNAPIRDDDLLKETIVQGILLQEMAVRRILEIEMTDQIYLVHPDLPGGRIPLGQSVDALIEALYRMTGEGYTHVVMSTDLRDFNRDRSVFPYGIYTALSKAIRVLEYNRDPRSLFLQRS